MAIANQSENPLLLAAIEYCRLNWRVHPVRPREKKPILGNWPERASKDEVQVHEWWGKWPNANIGVVTGPITGIVVLDVDGEAGEKSLEQLMSKSGSLPRTCMQRTGRGRQLIFAYPTATSIHNATRLAGLEGLDVRGDGGYVIVPPSVHPNGRLYEWQFELNPLRGGILSQLPPAWIELITNPQVAVQGEPSTFSGHICEGKRNDHIFRTACSLRARGLSRAAVSAALKIENQERCQPPLSDKEVEAITVSASRYPTNMPGVPASASVPWDAPIPFGQFELPTFPLEAFPADLSVLSEFCQSVAESLQVPSDLVALLVLAVGGAALAKRVEVHGSPDWVEPVNLYVAIAMPPGERKSAVIKLVSRPIEDFEREVAMRLAPFIEQSRTERAILVKAVAEAMNRAAKATKSEDRAKWKKEANRLTEDLSNLEVVVAPRLLADDASPEALSRLMYENGGRMSVLSPEGDTFELMGGRYSANRMPNLGVYLKAHCGDCIRVDRVNKDRPPEFIENPALTLGLAVQPDVLRGLAQEPRFRERGLLARFLYSIPQSRVGFRKLRPDGVPKEIRSAYEILIKGILALGDPTLTNVQEAIPLRLSPQALNELDVFRELVETELRETGKLGPIRDWGSKLPGLVLRISGIFHGLMNARSGRLATEPIGIETMLGAIAIGEYAIAHARAAFFVMGADPALELAKRILDWIREERLTKLSRRDAFQRLRGLIHRVEDIDPPLSLLVEHGFVRAHPAQAENSAGKKGRKPSPVFEVNPFFLAQNVRDKELSTNSAHSGNCAPGEATNVFGA